MAQFAKFLRLYWTGLPTGIGRVVADPVRVEVFQGPRAYDVFNRAGPPVVRAGVEHTIATQQRFEVPGDRTYIEFIARTDESLGRRQYCEDHINRVVTQLSAVLSPALFSQEVWSGWLSDSGRLVGDFWLMTAPPVSFESDEVQKRLAAFRDAVANDAEIERRFTLMSKLFARAVATPPGEERFLWLWTVLEVFPMRDTSNIQPISEYLSQTTGHTPDEVKNRLDIGRLFGARCSLVHDGKLPYGREAIGSVLKRLETIDRPVSAGSERTKPSFAMSSRSRPCADPEHKRARGAPLNGQQPRAETATSLASRRGQSRCSVAMTAQVGYVKGKLLSTRNHFN